MSSQEWNWPSTGALLALIWQNWLEKLVITASDPNLRLYDE
jgi:hypothetical protein